MDIGAVLYRSDLRSFRRDPVGTGKHIVERLDRARRPVEQGGRILAATVEVTFLCNLRCPMCSQWGTNGVGHLMLRGEVDNSRIKQQMSLDELKRLADQLVPHRSIVHLIGGEPFLRKDTIDYVEYLSEIKLPTKFVTNGTLFTDSVIDRMGRAKYLVDGTFSIDGAEADHDAVRGKGAYRKTMAAISKLAVARNLRKGGPRMTIRLNTTIQPGNVHHLRDLVVEAKANGVDAINLIHLRWMSKDRATRHHQMLLEDFGIDDRGVYGEVGDPFPPEFPDQVFDTIRSLRREFGSLVYTNAAYLTREQTRRYYTDLSYVIHPHCAQPWREIWVKADGNVIFCPDQWIAGYSIGNVKEEPLEGLWQGTRAARFRQALTGHGLWPGCARCCITNGDHS